MVWSSEEKEQLKREVVTQLKDEPEVQRIVVFGSFLTSAEPRDLDVAIFQSTNEKYLPLALKYRGKLDGLAGRIALDVIPLKSGADRCLFSDEVDRGEMIYERA